LYAINEIINYRCLELNRKINEISTAFELRFNYQYDV